MLAACVKKKTVHIEYNIMISGNFQNVDFFSNHACKVRKVKRYDARFRIQIQFLLFDPKSLSKHKVAKPSQYQVFPVILQKIPKITLYSV